LNILILNYEYPPLGGGAGIVTQHLANEFIHKGNQVTVLTTWYTGEPEYHAENNLTVIRLLSRRKYAYQSNPAEMYDWMKKSENYALMHFTKGQFDVCLANFTLPGGAVANTLKQKLGLPFIILSHGHDVPWFSPKQMFFWHLLCFPVIKYYMKQSAFNVLLTNDLKLNADKFLGSKFAAKNVVIPNGLLSFDLRKGFDAEDKIIRALFVGRLVEQKDPLAVVRAFHKLQQQNIPIHLKIIGDGALRNAIEDYITRYQLNNIDLLGKISQSQVMEAYEHAHLLIAPSREEAMSLSVLEAISCGLYIIATKISGNRDVILEGLNGSFVEYGNDSDIAAKITGFYQDKFLKNYQYPELMMSFIQQNFSWENTAKKYLEIFTSAAHTNSV
jgi:glycosyltransferase involved in cell wall biosynthesis